MTRFRILNLFLVLIFQIVSAFCQIAKVDTLPLSLPDAEKIFLEKNLLLVANKLNIDAAKAQIIQAKLWDNPAFLINQNIFNQQTKKYFDATSLGQTDIQIQQFIFFYKKLFFGLSFSSK